MLSKVDPRLTIVERIGDELLDQLGRPRRGGDDRLRLGAEAQAEQRLLEGVGPRHAASSSSQTFRRCFPRSRSGSSAEKSCETAPFGQARRPAARAGAPRRAVIVIS